MKLKFVFLQSLRTGILDDNIKAQMEPFISRTAAASDTEISSKLKMIERKSVARN